ncbi:MAG TPA: ubiquinone/menaquinone biosynthesis methyltransferase [Spirochaetia bacterium]|nr:ubiquinone/menaquinone biosynthesis methyltransferase [Spirochaetia bacterium]
MNQSSKESIDTLYQSVDVHDLFARVVKTYDLLNHVFSFNIDRAWRTRAVKAAALPANARVLDVATGTADLAIAFARRHPDCRVDGVDFVEEMLERGRQKVIRALLGDRVVLSHGDALSLSCESDSYDAAAIAFGMRNLTDVPAGIREMVRAVKPGGTVVILEFSPPPATLFGRVYNWYLKHIMPAIGGKVAGWGPSYGYLYSSINAFLNHDALADRMRSEGLTDIQVKRLSGGIAYIHSGTKVKG